MNKSVKAVLFSALVFPGAGHFYLRKYIRGMVLASITLVSLYFIIANVVERAQQIVDKILLGEVQPDIAVIAELVSKQPTGADAEFLNYVWTALIIAWLIGIADSYRVGRGQDKADVADD
jgi:heme/copper-type cytochrome/quinol oxidase subunit 4